MWFGLSLWILAGLQAPAAHADPLAPAGVCAKLRSATREVAKAGDAELVTRMRAVLAGLGDDPDELAEVAGGWQRTVVEAKPTRSTRPAAANRVRRDMTPLLPALAREDGERKRELARWILELDAEQPEANAALGRARDADGQWLTVEEHRWKMGARRAAGAELAARELDFSIQHGTSENPTLIAVCGGGNLVRWQGLTIHSRLPPDTLERILRQALRAAALSRALLLDDLGLPKDLGKHEFVLLDTEAHFQPALDEARIAKGVTPLEFQRIQELGMRSFVDARGWRTSRWRSEADFEALVLWDMAWDWFGGDSQPCLRVGHVNWVCLNFLGTSMPMLVWSEQAGPLDERSVTQRDEAFLRQALWRSARSSLWGCRAWMVRQVRAKSDPPWVRALLDQDGKIRDENLLKTTLMCELLQQEGRLGPLLKDTRGKKDVAAALEQALGEKLPDLEERWRRWLDPPPRVGVVQALEGPVPAPEAESPFRTALLRLNQARADALKGQFPEIPIVALDPELSRAAELHAHYLALNPEQKALWPDVHHERPDAPGFTPAGSLSGSRSVIAFDGDPDVAVVGWLGTFFHRLPLLDPGLFGVGFGREDEVIVLDAHSLVLAPWRDHVVRWPLPEAENVPVRMRPESPNPVPGENQSGLGYPLTLQLFFAEPRTRVEVVFELFRGAPEAGKAVDCHVITPTAPLQIELVPENAWCLIPKAPLSPGTLYTARASFDGRTEQWSFTTAK